MSAAFLLRSGLSPDLYRELYAEVKKFIGDRGYVYPRNLNPFPGEAVRVRVPETGEVTTATLSDGFLTFFVRVATELEIYAMPAYYERPVNGEDVRVRLAYTVNPSPKLAYFSYFGNYEFPDESLLNPTDPRRVTIENEDGILEEWVFVNSFGVRWQEDGQYVRYIARTDLLQWHKVTKESNDTDRFHYHGDGYTVAALIPHALRVNDEPVTKIKSLEFYDGETSETCFGKMLYVPSDYKLWFVGSDLLMEQEELIESHLMVLRDFSVVVPHKQPIDLYVLRIRAVTQQDLESASASDSSSSRNAVAGSSISREYSPVLI